MKNIFIFLSVFICFSINSQSFNFLREWGTYVGGGGTQIFNGGSNNSAFIVDNQNNIFLNASVQNYNSVYPASYYNQFAISTGGYPFVNNTTNFFLTEFNANGNQAYGAYKGTATGGNERLLAIDSQNNRYVVKQFQGLISNLATPGAWLATYPSNATTSTLVLYKYDSTGNIIYSTYLPNQNLIHCIVQGDEVFVIGNTSQEIAGLSNPGVFQEQYQNYASAGQTTSTNGYYVKLSATGSKVIGTYLPFQIYAKLYNGGLYFLSGTTEIPANYIQAVVTPNTFQQSGGNQIFVKFDANTATLVLGDNAWC